MNLIVDGANLAHRARHAYSLSYQGQDTSVTYGVMRMLGALVKYYNPASVIFAWDGGTPGFRRRLVPSYKSKRKHDDDPTWDMFIYQVQELEHILPYAGVLQVRRAGIEADDLMAQAAQMLIGKNLIVSTDTDMLQCVNDNTSVLRPGKKDVTYDAKNFEKLVGFPVYKYVLGKVLQGDSSDNVPGVLGIGPKTVVKLLQNDNVLEAATPKMRSRIEAFISDGHYNSAYSVMDLSADHTGARLALLDAPWRKAHAKRLTKWCMDHGFVSIIEAFSLSIFGSLQEPEFAWDGRMPLVWDYRRYPVENRMTAEEYVHKLELVLAPHFAPGGIYNGKDGAMRLAREVGYGLRELEGADKVIQTLYSRLLVRFTLATNVPVDAKPWFDEIRRAMNDGSLLGC